MKKKKTISFINKEQLKREFYGVLYFQKSEGFAGDWFRNKNARGKQKNAAWVSVMHFKGIYCFWFKYQIPQFVWQLFCYCLPLKAFQKSQSPFYYPGSSKWANNGEILKTQWDEAETTWIASHLGCFLCLCEKSGKCSFPPRSKANLPVSSECIIGFSVSDLVRATDFMEAKTVLHWNYSNKYVP